MVKKRCLLAIVFALMSGNALGADVWHTSKIYSVYPNANGTIVVQFDTDAPSCTNASSVKFFYISVGENSMTQEGLNNIYALLLTALTTDREVTVNFSDSSNACYINRAKLHRSTS